MRLRLPRSIGRLTRRPTSADGDSWTKVEDPVMTPGFCGDFDRAGLSQGPLLPLNDGGYLLPYGGHDGGNVGASIGLA